MEIQIQEKLLSNLEKQAAADNVSVEEWIQRKIEAILLSLARVDLTNRIAAQDIESITKIEVEIKKIEDSQAVPAEPIE